jgi:hypothetical protein
MHMDNKLIEFTFPPGTTFRKGIPADAPKEVFEAFVPYISAHPNVESLRLGLVEFLPPGRPSVFSYVVGVSCTDSSDGTVADLKKIALAAPMGRWGVMIVPYAANQYLFTSEALLVFHRKRT